MRATLGRLIDRSVMSSESETPSDEAPDGGAPAAGRTRALGDDTSHRVRIREEQFRLLVESVKDYAIFMLTPDGRVASWNAGAQNIKGYTADEVIGQHFSVFYPPDLVARGWPEHELRIARTTGRYEEEGWRLRKDGSRFWASVTITALYDETGSLRGFGKVTRDLTARRQIEELRRGERLTNEFLAMLGHELRNPLAPLQMAVEILELRRDDAKAVDWVRNVFSRQVGHLTRLVDDLLDVGRITSGKVNLRFETVDLAVVVRETLEVMRPQLDARNQALELVLPDVPVHVRADATRLAQVITNLAGNASKYTANAGRIEVRLDVDEQNAVVTVSDNGMGIGPHLLPRVFDLFVQGDRALDRQDGGLGIGLTLARRLVELHGGTLGAASAGIGQGSQFSVQLPRLVHLPAAADAPSETGGASALRVLVVDDNEDVARSIEMLLQILGHDVEVAHDGVAALALARKSHPDVVLLDLGLPLMNGYDVARALRGDARFGTTLLVACTGYGREQDRDRVREAGFDEHLVKPVHAADLARLLGDYAQRRLPRADASRSA
jgi:PAS domain S-box-containing protein